MEWTLEIIDMEWTLEVIDMEWTLEIIDMQKKSTDYLGFINSDQNKEQIIRPNKSTRFLSDIQKLNKEIDRRSSAIKPTNQ